jgi:hypothetical protein
MLRHCSSLLPTALLVLAACGSPASNAPTSPLELDTEGSLAAGATAAVKGTDLQITFVGVTNDSRCPTDVSCIWAGEVTVKLAMRLGGAAPIERESLEGRTTLVEPYRVTVTRVLPEPVSSKKLEPGDYRINLIVVKI